MCLHTELRENHPMLVEDSSATKPLEIPEMEFEMKLKMDDAAKKSKKRKQSSSIIAANDCHITKLEKFYPRVMLSLTKPSYRLGLGFSFVRKDNRTRLFHLLRKFVRQHNWEAAAGVLSVVLKGTCKDNSPLLNRFKYSISMEVLKHIEGDNVNLARIANIYDTWMARIGTNLSNKRNKDEPMKEDSFVVRLQLMLSRVMRGDIDEERYNANILMQERGYESHPLFNMILGLIFYQLWYSSIPEEMQWIDTFQIHSPTHSDMSATPSQPEISAMRFSCEVGDSEGHNAVFNAESDASFQCDSNTSVMKDKQISAEADGSSQREMEPMDIDDKLYGENHAQEFQPRGFYMNSAENDVSFDNNGGYNQFVPNHTVFENSSLWLLPLQPGNWELAQLVHNEDYKKAVKYLQEAVSSKTPVSAALLPLIQLLLIGCDDREALSLLDKFCADSNASLPKKMRANLLERVNPNNSVILSTCYEDTLKSDPTCGQSLARLIGLHRKGEYSPQSLLEMIALHLDAALAGYNTWREFALCFLKLTMCEEDRMSVCPHGNANEGEKRQPYSLHRKRMISKLFIERKSLRLWKSRSRWWATRHFSKSTLASETASGDLQLLTYKAACASHMYGQEFEYVVKAHTRLQKENDRDLLMFLRLHMQNSMGFLLHIKRRT